MTTRPLYKTTAVIWSEFDGTEVELSDLARQAEQGDAFCSHHMSEKIEDPDSDPSFPDNEFFFDRTGD